MSFKRRIKNTVSVLAFTAVSGGLFASPVLAQQEPLSAPQAQQAVAAPQIAPSAGDETPPVVEFGGQFTSQYIFDDNRDLGTQSAEPSNSKAVYLQLDALVHATETIDLYAETRFLQTFGDAGGVEDDSGEISTAEKFAELRELWVNFDQLAGVYPLSLKAGRQRIQERRNILWNDDLDAVRLSYDTTLFTGMVAVVNNVASFRTSEDDFLEDDEDRLRLLAEGSWLYAPDHSIDLRTVYENDYSKTEDVGEFVISDNRDDTDFNLLWTGARAHGKFIPGTAALFDAITYRADGIVVAGEEDVVSTGTSTAPFRVVTGTNSRDVLGFALDAGVDIHTTAPMKPVITLNYAYGSGDDDATDGTNNAYRDPDMSSGSSRYGIMSQSMHNYGDAFRPDLTNIHILTAGVGVPVMKNSDISVFYHRYIQDEKGTGLGTTRIQDSVNNQDTDVGQEIDVAFNVDLETELQNVVTLPDRTQLRLSSGTFFPGDAYEAADANDSAVWRALAELKFKF